MVNDVKKYLKRKRSTFIFHVTTALVTCSAIFLSALVYYKIANANCSDINTICLTPDCVQAAAQILAHMDITINPCDNFYAFVCGNFISKAELSENQEFVSTTSLIHENIQKQLREMLEEPIREDELKYIDIIKTYYNACSDVASIEKSGLDDLKVILNNLGNWPVLVGNDWNETDFSWYKSMYKLNALGLNADIFISLIFDHQNNSGVKLILDLPNLGLPTRFNNEDTRIYYHYMVGVAKKMGANESKAVEELNRSLEFEINLAHISKRESSVILTLYELDDRFPNIPWFEYIHKLMVPHMIITKGEKMLVNVQEYIKGLDVLLYKTPKRIQANYIMWKVIDSLIPYLNEEMRERSFNYKKAISNDLLYSKWQECITETYRSLPDLVNSFYVQKYFDMDSEENATILIRSIKNSFVEVLKTMMYWPNEETRNTVLKNAENIQYFIAFPKEILNRNRLGKSYAKLIINPKEYLKSHLNISMMNREITIQNLRRPMKEEQSSSSWFDKTQILENHVSYDPTKNSIAVSVGSLQGFLYNNKHPEYLNYGGLGFVVARVLAQSLTTLVKEEKQLCFIQQNNNFTIPDIELNGTITLTESMINNIALKLVYQAYTGWRKENEPLANLAAMKYSPNQLFWISFALNSCSREKPEYMKSLVEDFGELPAELKIISAVANSDDFAKDFKCPVGSPMNPTNNCSIVL